MNFKLAQLKLDTDCQAAITEIKKGDKYEYLILNITDNGFLRITNFEPKNNGVGGLLQKLHLDRCYYAVLSHNHYLILIAWIPGAIQNVEIDLYHRALMNVKELLKIEHLLIVDKTDLNWAKMEESIQKLLDCSVDKNIIQIPEIAFPIDQRGLGCLYYESMQKNRDKIAQILGLTGKTQTFGEILQRSTRLAMNMSKRGIEQGDVVSICSNDGENVAVPFIATLFLGATMSALDPSFALNDIINCLKEIRPKMMFVVPEALSNIENATEQIDLECKIVVFEETNNYTFFNDLIQPVEYEDDFRPVPVNLLETAFIVFTSGSTGTPKSICQNHHSTQYQYYNFIHSQFGWDTILHYCIPYWTVYTKFLGVSIILGTKRLIYSTFYEHFWHFTKYQVTTMLLSVAEVSTLCTYKRPKTANLQGVKILIIGNVMSQNYLDKIQQVFYDSDLFLSYGLTEIPNGLTVFQPHDETHIQLKEKYPSSVGKGQSGLSYKIVNPETEEILGPNKKGELRIKTAFPLGGYFKVQPTPLWDSYGWLKTGDLAYYNEDHCFYIVDRIKNMFKYKDYHIIPSVIENVLNSHPAVHRAAVIGVPNEIDGHHPLGVVVLKPTYGYVTNEALQSFVEKKVPDYQRLRAGVKIVDKLPTTATGKICKWVLQKSFTKD